MMAGELDSLDLVQPAWFSLKAQPFSKAQSVTLPSMQFLFARNPLSPGDLVSWSWVFSHSQNAVEKQVQKILVVCYFGYQEMEQAAGVWNDEYTPAAGMPMPRITWAMDIEHDDVLQDFSNFVHEIAGVASEFDPTLRVRVPTEQAGNMNLPLVAGRIIDLRNNGDETTFFFDRKYLYLRSYEGSRDENPWHLKPDAGFNSVQLPNSQELEFDCSYTGLREAAGLDDVSDAFIGLGHLCAAVRVLVGGQHVEDPNSEEAKALVRAKARSLLCVVHMVSEAARFRRFLDYLLELERSGDRIDRRMCRLHVMWKNLTIVLKLGESGTIYPRNGPKMEVGELFPIDMRSQAYGFFRRSKGSARIRSYTAYDFRHFRDDERWMEYNWIHNFETVSFVLYRAHPFDPEGGSYSVPPPRRPWFPPGDNRQRDYRARRGNRGRGYIPSGDNRQSDYNARSGQRERGCSSSGRDSKRRRVE